jgi:predicted deacetylase
MFSKFVLRFDDIAPEMAWSKFDQIQNAMVTHDVKPIVGVVPHCLDPEIMVEPKNDRFWERVRHWNELGWTIAQHGYTHQYESADAGVLGINNNSEFAGLPFEIQLEKLRNGKAIMEREGVWQPVFMAPAHSFDMETIRALEELNFRYLTDGYGLYPYRIDGITALPQLFAKPVNFGFGIYTICVHINSMSPTQIAELVRFVRENSWRFISFEHAVRRRCGIPGIEVLCRGFLSKAIPTIRMIRRLL